MSNETQAAQITTVEALNAEIANLKNQLAQNSQGVNNLLAQIEAYKQMVNEQQNINLILRTNSILLQRQYQEQENARASNLKAVPK